MYEEQDGHWKELRDQRRIDGYWPYYIAYVLIANNLSVAIAIVTATLMLLVYVPPNDLYIYNQDNQ